MSHKYHNLMLALLALTMGGVGQGSGNVYGQQSIGFIEKFATATDRRELLAELIPGTDDYFYFHTLHYQNQGELANARQTLEAWRTKLGDVGRVPGMFARQQLLEYATHPQQTLRYLRQELGLKLDHAPPARDRAATLLNTLDNSQLDPSQLLEQLLAHDRTLTNIESGALGQLLNRKLSVDQLRGLLGRLDRGDQPHVVTKIAEELALQDSAGFGWAKVHSLLTVDQLRDLQRLLPQLIENDSFVRAITARLAPPAGTELTDKPVLRRYLERLREWTQTLPPSQNSFKALVLGNLLRLDLSEARWDRQLFLDYLKLPRATAYYEPRKLANLNVGLVQLDFTMHPQVPLPAMGDDSELVQRYLEHFLQADESVDAFAPYLQREFLDRIWAQTKILYGLGPESTWYAKLSATEQQELRERVELRFAPHNPLQFSTDEAVGLEVELKNVDQLMVRIYEINSLNYYRDHSQPPGTDIDLDGLVPNQQRQLNFSQPPQRRHVERIEFPDFASRGTWVIDLLGAGQRSRAVVQRGRLLAMEQMGDAGQVFQVVNELGQSLPTAHVELGGRKYLPGEDARIIIPYAERTIHRKLLLVDGDFAMPMNFTHHSENYELQVGFVIDRQTLVAGKQAEVAIRPRLTCNGRPISIRLLTAASLTIQATDSEGISSTQSIDKLDLDDGDELVHSFLVPQRLSQLKLTLSGQVAKRSRDELVTVQSAMELQCNGIQRTSQIADFYLRETTTGYRLLVLGRNGEPIARLPLSLSIKLTPFTTLQHFTLATTAAGAVELGRLRDVQYFTVSAEGLQPESFALSRFSRQWPTILHVARDEAIELPLGTDTADSSQFSLAEIRRGVVHQRWSQALRLGDGRLHVDGLAPGDYTLHDYETGAQVTIVVADSQRLDGWLAAPHRLLQASPPTTLVIRQAVFEDKQLRVHVDGADKLTRIHLLATPFKPLTSGGRQVYLPPLPLHARGLPTLANHYVNSLRLDEEYSYILDRQLAHKYPGNPLPHPTVLINPWEVSVTENRDKQAASGDALPPAAAMPEPQSPMAAEAEALATGARPDWKCYDFLAQGSVLLANYEVIDGVATFPIADLAGYSSFTVLAVHPIASDSRQIVRDAEELPIRDLRLREAFDSQLHLAQVHKVEVLTAGEKKILGDPRTRRFQTYSSIADVFQLYSTLLSTPEWEKFRFVSRWHELSPAQRAARYNEMACHELNFFLYHHDRPFFDRVIAPLLTHKLDKQLVDLWLLDQPLDSYLPLWRIQRMNTLERILMASRVHSQKVGTERWLRELLEARPLSPSQRQQRFEVALRGSALSADGSSDNSQLGLFFARESDSQALAGRLQDGGYGGSNAPMSHNRLNELRRSRGRAENAEAKSADASRARDLKDEFFGVDRIRPGLQEQRLFQTLDQTREWAEAQYYHVRLSQQATSLLPANPFWQEFLQAGGQPFLPRNLDLPCGSLNEALCALAVIDLPLQRGPLQVAIEDDQLSIHSPSSPAIVFLESIEPTTEQATTEQIRTQHRTQRIRTQRIRPRPLRYCWDKTFMWHNPVAIPSPTCP
jgi:hypothetical protein